MTNSGVVARGEVLRTLLATEDTFCFCPGHFDGIIIEDHDPELLGMSNYFWRNPYET